MHSAYCGCRFRTENANSLFVRELRQYTPKPGISELYFISLKECYLEQTRGQQSNRKQILSQIDELNIRLRNAREMVADQKFDPEDYRELKLDCANKINMLEAKLAGTSQVEKSIDELLEKAVGNLGRLNTLYEEGSVAQKRQIVGSIYPEKMVFLRFPISNHQIEGGGKADIYAGSGF